MGKAAKSSKIHIIDQIKYDFIAMLAAVFAKCSFIAEQFFNHTNPQPMPNPIKACKLSTN
ncbi:hypothetical protein B0189_01455 [Moraxella cuniculi]|nr:hypothetical protein B0189_01455 [Moraxella cuniculi]